MSESSSTDLDRKRNLRFIFGCLGSRSLLVYLAYRFEKTGSNHLQHLAMITSLIAAGFLTIYTFGLRKTGIEVDGQRIWWNNLRPVHGFFYLMFSLSVFLKRPNAWVWLLLDTLLGAAAFTAHRLLKIV